MSLVHFSVVTAPTPSAVGIGICEEAAGVLELLFSVITAAIFFKPNFLFCFVTCFLVRFC